MKRKILFLGLILTLNGCFKSDDDTKDFCNSDCTLIEGSFVTKNNTPVSGINLSLAYDISAPPFSGSTRKIRETKSNQQGNYKMEFFIKDSEIGNNEGFFKLLVDLSNLDDNKYLIPDNLPLLEAIYEINRRDTIIKKSFYIPTKAHITINLENFNPIQEGDIFKIQTLFPYGLKIGQNTLLDSQYRAGMTGFDDYIAIAENQSFSNVVVAENENNIIRIIKIKNGVAEPEDIQVFVPERNDINLTFEY